MSDDFKKEIIDFELKGWADRDRAFVTNTDKGAYSPDNLFFSVLSEKGFHIRFEQKAVDLEGRTVEGLTAVYIDDHEEREKYYKISMVLQSNGLFKLYWLAVEGNIVDKDLDQADELSDEDKKALKVLSLMKGRERKMKFGFTNSAEENSEQIEAHGILPYSLQLMREKIVGMVDEILKVHPELVLVQTE